jgi:hypothetical protein
VETAKDPECKFPAPRIHACVFDPKDGRLKQLDVNCSEYLDELRDVYELCGNVDELGLPVPETPDDSDPEKPNKLKLLKNFFGIGE